LVDCVPQTLACWHRTLRDFGYAFTEAQLQAYSGLDGRDMLDRLLPAASGQQEKTKILKEQGKRYRATITLGWLERWAGNETIAERLRAAGFSEVSVSGSGATRMAEAVWAGPDATGDMPAQVTEVIEI